MILTDADGYPFHIDHECCKNLKNHEHFYDTSNSLLSTWYLRICIIQFF